jgi:hypothetical protein
MPGIPGIGAFLGLEKFLETENIGSLFGLCTHGNGPSYNQNTQTFSHYKNLRILIYFQNASKSRFFSFSIFRTCIFPTGP